MKLLLLESPPQVEQVAGWLSETGGFDITLAHDVDDALDRLQQDAIDAVLLSLSFTESREQLAEFLDYCEPGNPAVLLILDDLDDIHVLDGSNSSAIEDFIVKPFGAAMLHARLRFIQQRRNNILLPRQALLAALPDLMFRLKRDGTYLDYHFPSPEPAYVPSKELEGVRLQDGMPAEVAEVILDAVAGVLDSEEATLLEYQLPSIDHDIHSYEARIVPSGADEVLSIVRDVTEQKRADAALRDAAAMKQAFTSRVVSAQEAERQRLSRQLHEGIGQNILVHRMAAEWLTQLGGDDALREAAEGLCSDLDKTMESIRNMAMDLRPPAIDDLGIASALETLVGHIGKRSGIDCQCEVDSSVAFVSNDVAIAVYRIAQEALANAERHSQCKSIKVSLRYVNQRLEITIRDDGIGFDPSAEEASRSMGLLGMRQRAELVGGCVTIESSANQGTCVKVSVPSPTLRIEGDN